MVAYAGIYLGMDGSSFVDLPDSIGDAQTLCAAPGHLPELLRRSPYGTEALGALAKIGFLPGDAHGDDLVVAAARPAEAGAPGDGFHDQLHGLEPAAGLRIVEVAHAHQAFAVALDQFLGAVLAGAQGEASLHASPNGWKGCAVDGC